jgi:hypothetical protein
VSLLNLVCYADDLTLGISDLNTGLAEIDQLLKAIKQFGFKLKLSKCSFLSTSIDVCGFHIEGGTISETHYVEGILKLDFPKTKRQVRALIGKLQFARHLHENLAEYLQPFCELLKVRQKNGPVHKTAELVAHFQKLKIAMSTRRVLGIFQSSLPVIIPTDAAD